MATIQPPSSDANAAVQYDLTMAKYALERALQRLPPEAMDDTMTWDYTGSFFGTLHQDFRAAIFTVEQISYRITLEGISGQHPVQQQPPTQTEVPFVDVGWNITSWLTEQPPAEAGSMLFSSAGQQQTTPMASFGALPVAQSASLIVEASSGDSTAGTGAQTDVGAVMGSHIIFPPSDAQYASLPPCDQLVAHRLWDQLETFASSTTTQDLWSLATRKLAELRIQGNGRGTWGDHVVRETATWRCLKVWQAVRQDVQIWYTV